MGAALRFQALHRPAGAVAHQHVPLVPHLGMALRTRHPVDQIIQMIGQLFGVFVGAV